MLVLPVEGANTAGGSLGKAIEGFSNKKGSVILLTTVGTVDNSVDD
jgi:hypothetical protein